MQVGSITLLAPLTSAPVLRLSLPLHGHCMLAPGAEPFLGSHAVADSLHELRTPPKCYIIREGFGEPVDGQNDTITISIAQAH